jgi:hypothetical protein
VAPDSSASDQPSQAKLAEDQVSQVQPFVGRERKFRQLQGAFGTAAKGDGALILLVGEPGIGKTALLDQLCSFVSASGGLPLLGHCYSPFVEVLGTYLHGARRGPISVGASCGARVPLAAKAFRCRALRYRGYAKPSGCRPQIPKA